MTETHMERAQSLAAKITKKAEDALAAIDREMTIMQWPPEFRAIMWETVAHIASRRGAMNRNEQ